MLSNTSLVANVLKRRSVSSVPRFRTWYKRRLLVFSGLSPSRGMGGNMDSAGDSAASEGDWVCLMCSGVFGRTQGSARRGTEVVKVLVERDRCRLEMLHSVDLYMAKGGRSATLVVWTE
ncbi:hypothetical protein OE88DRAFT_472780 [Heliocybe sulcata]|uniref:Uncharacterized protein n=1 Tax=Heliocybe sulcata TaxID=5364 RepID=A0A5C3MVS8_9AGAM|nr:hypothetical protein OE88DRAFT_472780 [Heliocybe sulcata]